MNGIHDIGGMDGFGPISREENEQVFHEAWEGRMRAIHTIVSKKLHIYNTDEGRYAVERVNPIYYLGSTYSQIWLLRMEELLIEKGVLNKKVIDERMKNLSSVTYIPHLQSFRHLVPPIRSSQRRDIFPIEASANQKDATVEPRFSPGNSVVVKKMSVLGHTRAPRYVRGKKGVVVSIHGTFPVPDIKVQEGNDVYQPVYLIRFEAQDIWGEDASPKDKLYIEMWENYLE